MPNTPATNRFNKLIDDISNLYIKARNAQVEFGWETGRRLVQEEQGGASRVTRGEGLILQVFEVMTQKYGAGFSVSNLLKMRRFYLLNPYQAISTDMDWSDYVELLPIKDEKTRKRLEKRVLKEGLTSTPPCILINSLSMKATRCAWRNREKENLKIVPQNLLSRRKSCVILLRHEKTSL